VSDAQISKLIGTTKPTINSIRERTHWKINTINPIDPVSLGLCTQIDLDSTVKKASDKKAKLEAKTQQETGESLKPVKKTTVETDTNQSKVEHTLESLFKPSKV
jgi:hypothetical protein